MSNKAWFFGSFDPIHNGHVSFVKTALEYFKEVIICPTYQNPFKNGSKPIWFRLDLLYKVFSKNERVIVCYEEEELKSKYTSDFLNNSSFDFDNDIIVLTNETYNEIPKWFNGSEILAKCKFFIVDKEVQHSDIPFGKIDEEMQESLHSSDIRKLIKNGDFERVKRAVPKEIYEDVINSYQQ